MIVPKEVPSELRYRVQTGPDEVIRVHLSGNAANVLVMDDANLRSYREGREYNYWGGYYTQTPVTVKPGLHGVPLNVLVNLGGFAGSVIAVVEVVYPRRRGRR